MEICMVRKVSSIVFSCLCFFGFSQSNLQLDYNDYSFIVAGHAYGNHFDDNVGLYPTFYDILKSKKGPGYDFVVFTGDAVRKGTEEGFRQVKNQLNDLGIPFYLCAGNHEVMQGGHSFFLETYGQMYYDFMIGNEKFIVLDSQEEPLSISLKQINFFKSYLNDSLYQGKNVFIFFHELLWNSK